MFSLPLCRRGQVVSVVYFEFDPAGISFSIDWSFDIFCLARESGLLKDSDHPQDWLVPQRPEPARELPDRFQDPIVSDAFPGLKIWWIGNFG